MARDVPLDVFKPVLELQQHECHEVSRACFQSSKLQIHPNVMSMRDRVPLRDPRAIQVSANLVCIQPAPALEAFAKIIDKRARELGKVVKTAVHIDWMRSIELGQELSVVCPDHIRP